MMGKLMSYLLVLYLSAYFVNGLPLVTSPRESNASVTFQHQLTQQDTQYDLVLRLGGHDLPFYHNNAINPNGLKPGQSDRFRVHISQSKNWLTIIVQISNLHEMDGGTYRANIVEGFGSPNIVESNYQTVLEVTYPPGKAECELQKPNLLYEKWQTVHCTATLGNDESGHLVCLQNNIQNPYLHPVTHQGIFMTAVFWVDPKYDLRCCSTNNNYTIDKDACNDFMSTIDATSAQPVTFAPITNMMSTVFMSSPSTTNTACDGENVALCNDTILLACLIVIWPLVITTCLEIYRFYKTRRHQHEIHEMLFQLSMHELSRNLIERINNEHNRDEIIALARRGDADMSFINADHN